MAQHDVLVATMSVMVCEAGIEEENHLSWSNGAAVVSLSTE